MWEMQGELGTSHAYEMGGDYRGSPNYAQGFLGADFVYDAESNGYRITHIPHGDAWEATKDSPLNAPGVNVREGDILLAIAGQRVSETVSPGECLVNLANQEVQATFQNASDGKNRDVTLKILGSERELRYREWVSNNRRYVHEKTDGKVGYVHIPDMGRRGYAEFHRGFLAEVSYPGLLVDVRYNGGGHVSQLLLEKLSRHRIGYDVPRWGTPHPYPDASVLGPMVAVTNENAGSDGDIFSHCFKLMELGLLIGSVPGEALSVSRHISRLWMVVERRNRSIRSGLSMSVGTLRTTAQTQISKWITVRRITLQKPIRSSIVRSRNSSDRWRRTPRNSPISVNVRV